MSEELAVVIVSCTGMLSLAAVLILRPLSRRLGSFLDAMTESKLRATPEADMARIHDALNSIDGRLNHIEERQDFAEALISASDAKLLTIPAPVRAPERN